MVQATKKSEYKSVRKLQQIQQEKQRKRMKKLIWGTGIVVVALIIVALIFAPKNDTTFNYDQIPTLGKADAPIKIVEFGDYKCPVCKDFREKIEQPLKKDFIDKGTASFSFMNFTIISEDSKTAALAGQSIYHQNKDEFWKFYDAIYTNQGSETVAWATPDYLVELAKREKLAVDYDKLKSDIVNGTYQSEVAAHYAKAQKLNLNSTPSIFINGVQFKGNILDYDAIKKAIEQAQKDLK
ncbi:putative disulfide bond formation protein D [Paenibacillus baekrokdamisoli]|uniref:Putative disulfide bond formation protein D n=1 Tax=Paenibacillus baekrokdamisoli TaxID=1712516 RepID=A0A3G9IPH2_9BACL|nr:thioredoxin domain-containing protein [Paenibacillus baekrokdamisoli]MBB3069879.1 protein-disulfide isomerase [Paenibacillus baekrokdamisoli]BBH20767.1 putative disulfide bond formation protein D [Paenibacillus baekrokdamisoli]